MKKTHSFLMLVAGMILSLQMVSAAPTPNADLQVQLTGPSSVAISNATTYTVTVKTLSGNATPGNINVQVELPVTNTSPTVHILGTVSGLDTSKCSIVARKISCNLGSLKKGKTTSFTFNYAAPVSTKPLTMKATVTSNIADNSPANNTSNFTPTLAYPDREITSGVITNSHCTGTNLTSYFECLLFPSSLSSHTVTFNVGGTIDVGQPGYTGTWSQPTLHELHFEYFDLTGKVAEFNGFAINGSNCFDGLTNFFPDDGYVSPYRVCIQ